MRYAFAAIKNVGHGPVEAMVKALMEYETIDSNQIKDIMEGKPVRAPKPSSTPPKPK